jgi:hypothetical protein
MRPQIKVNPKDVSLVVKSEPVKKPTIKMMEPAKVKVVTVKETSTDIDALKIELHELLAKMQTRAFSLAQKDWLFVEMGKEANRIQLAIAEL